MAATNGGASREVGTRDMEMRGLVNAAEGCSSRDLAELSLIAHSMATQRAAGPVDGKALNPYPIRGGVGEYVGSATATTGPRGLTLENVEEAFTFQPWDGKQQQAGQIVREALVQAARTILRNVPDGPDRSVALRKLREVRMDCNSAITFDGRF